MGKVNCTDGNPYSRSVASYNGWDTRRNPKKKNYIKVASLIMSKIWSEWDDNSPTHNYWKRKVKKSHRGWNYWKNKYRAIQKKNEE